jgi:hypothetical protein
MSDYVQDALDVDTAMREDGQLITITRKVKGAYVAGRVSLTEVVEHVWGIETDLTARDYGVGVAAGGLVQSGDRKLMISTLEDTGALLSLPKVDDLVLAGGQTYTLKNVDKLAPGGIPVMYTLVGRL